MLVIPFSVLEFHTSLDSGTLDGQGDGLVEEAKLPAEAGWLVPGRCPHSRQNLTLASGALAWSPRPGESRLVTVEPKRWRPSLRG